MKSSKPSTKPQASRATTLFAAAKSFGLLFCLPLLLPAAWMLHLIGKYGVSFPYSDAWLIVPTFQHIDQGHIIFHDFWQPGSYHRLFFTNILIALMAYASNWNIKWEMYASFLFCAITAFLIYLMASKAILRKGLLFLFMLITTFWLFSPVQSENWLWGWDVSWFLCTVTAVASIYFLTRTAGKYLYVFLGLAIGFAILSTFSFGWGQAIWPVGLAMLLAQRQKLYPVLAWVGAALLSYGAYYYHFQHDGPPVPYSAFLHHPINAAGYFLTMFGRPFVNESSIGAATMVGGILLLSLIPLLYLAWERRTNPDRKYLFPWLALILFSLIGAFMIILGRMVAIPGMETPLSDAMQSRYTAMPLLYLIGLSGLGIALLSRSSLSRKTVRLAVVCILVFQIPLVWSSYSVGNLTSHQRQILMTRLQACSKVPTDKVAKDCFSSNNYRNDLNTAKQQLQFLKDKHWAGY